MDRLRVLRIQRGLTQEQLSEALGIDRLSIARYESGARSPKLVTLISLADFFNVSIDYLLERTDCPMLLLDSDKGPSPEEWEQAQVIANAALKSQLDQEMTAKLSAADRRWLRRYIDTAVRRALDKYGLPHDDPSGSPGQTDPPDPDE